MQWSLVLALATLVGSACQRQLGLPRMLGYAAVGRIAGCFGLGAALWPLQGPVLFLLELGIAVVLFECRCAHQCALVCTQPHGAGAKRARGGTDLHRRVFRPAGRGGSEARGAGPLGLLAVATSQRCCSVAWWPIPAPPGPVTDRALTLSTLSTLYALVLSAAKATDFSNPQESLWHDIAPVLQVLLVSAVVAGVLFALFHAVLRWMSPLSQNTAIVLLALIAATAASASGLGGSAPWRRCWRASC